MNKEREEAQDGMAWHLRIAVTYGHLTAKQAAELELTIKEYFANHWRDDDSPQAEITFGVRRLAA